MLLHFPDEADAAARLARAAGLPLAPIAVHAFPDGETRLTLPPAVPAQTVLLRTLARPNDKLVALLLAAQTARELGARHLTLVAPYLAYMRQDIAFAPGEAVSQRHVGRFLAALFDTVITVDPHLHRVNALADAVPAKRAVALSAAPLLGALIARERPGALLVGPDEEAAQWVEAAAAAAQAEWAVCRKRRRGDRQVEIALPSLSVMGREVVLLDDVASTGGTLIAATRGLRAAGAARVAVAVTHALLSAEAEAQLRAAGADALWSTDSVAHPSNRVELAPLLAAALRA